MRSTPSSAAATAPEVAPKPPKKTLPIERFIASAICLVRIEPDAPTSMPATISAVLSSAMPAAAALSPVNAFSVEITTGMSAPPIGSTAVIPSTPAATSSSQKRIPASAPATMITAITSVTAASPTLASVSGRAGKRRLAQESSWSFANATFEPQNEIEPMIAANTIGISSSSAMSCPSRNSTRLISATAPPPTPLNSATICGIAVIFTLRAAGMPTAVPITIPITISAQSPIRSSSSVPTSAIPIPTAATWLPRTAVRGPRTIRRPAMKSAKPTM